MNRIVQAYLIAKRENTNDIIYYSDEFKLAKAREVKVQRRFANALKKREFLVYYQPKVDIHTRKIIGAEALCRWIHKGTLIPPIDFIPALERGYDICRLDFYMLDSVCRDLRRWLDARLPVVRISVNLSRRHLVDPDLFEHIVEIIDRHGIPHDLIEIELTETTTDVEFRDLKRVVADLQASGISASVDDFGVGYSSLNLIKQIPWDVLKLDKSILPQEGDDEARGGRMFAHVIAMAHEMGLTCVAEGVETEDQLDIMRQYGGFRAETAWSLGCVSKPPNGHLEARSVIAQVLLQHLRMLLDQHLGDSRADRRHRLNRVDIGLFHDAGNPGDPHLLPGIVAVHILDPKALLNKALFGQAILQRIHVKEPEIARPVVRSHFLLGKGLNPGSQAQKLVSRLEIGPGKQPYGRVFLRKAKVHMVKGREQGLAV